MPSLSWRPTTPLAWAVTIVIAVVAVFILLGLFGLNIAPR